MNDVAPESWHLSPLLSCFHPSAERVFEEQLRMHRNIDRLRRTRSGRKDVSSSRDGSVAEPTLELVRGEHETRPIRPDEELTELVGMCLWDVFSDNHDVIVGDRVADIGSFRGASAFLDEYVERERSVRVWDGDYMRFYMGTAWIGERADLAPVYAMIFRRLRAVGANWVYHFPELFLIDLATEPTDSDGPTVDSGSQRQGAAQGSRSRAEDIARLRADMAESNAHAREAAMDRPAPATVRAYRQVYGCDPHGWPPV